MIYDLRTEKHVLAGLITHPKIFAEIERWIGEKDFYQDVHATTFSVIKQIVNDNKPLDKVIVALTIKNLGVSFKDDVNIADYLESICFSPPTELATAEAAQQLQLLRVRREVYNTAKEIATFVKSTGDKDLDEIISSCDSIYGDKMSSYEIENEPSNIFEDLEDLIEERGNNPIEEFGFSTPFPEFNRLYGGLRVGQIHAFASRPGQGKTTLLSHMALRTAQEHGCPVLILDTEMSKQEIQFRMVASLSGVPVWYLETGNWRKNEDMIKKVRAAMANIESTDYCHHHVGNKSVDEVCSMIRRWYLSHAKKAGKCIIVYDYLKLTGEKLSNHWAEHQAMGEKVDKFKRISEECNAAFLTAIQMNRTGENFNRSSGSVVYDSSAIAQSDRLQWFASFVGIFCRKTVDEIAEDGREFGTHKLVPLKTRFQGKDAAGHHDLIQRTMADGTTRWVNNELYFNVDNFLVEERGSVSQLVRRQNEEQDLSDDNDQGELL